MSNPLREQAEKIHKHARQGSIDTRRVYKKEFLRFCNWLWDNYRVQKLRNISNKHLQAYVEYMLEKGNKPSYITKILSSIRYYHNQVSNPRYELTTDNEALGLPKRERPGDRAWDEEECHYLKKKAREENQPLFESFLVLAWELGLRIHEGVRLYRVDIERALASGILTVKGKGGKIRDLPLTPAAERELQQLKKQTSRGARVFVPVDKQAHQVIKTIQDFIRINRKQREGEQLTAHGLRYNFTQRHLQEAEEKGLPKKQAEKQVSQLLGHNRREVTRGYGFKPKK